MTDTDPTIDLLDRALASMSTLVDGVRPDQLDAPTPCSKWAVRDLLRHVVGQDLRNFIAAVRGDSVDWTIVPDLPDGDMATAYRGGADMVLEAWRSADLDAPVPMPGGVTAPLRSRADMQIAELAVHAWDVARATGQSVDIDTDIVERSLAWSRALLRPEFRGEDKAFGREVPVPEDAPPADRLAGWFGRSPDWRPPG